MFYVVKKSSNGPLMWAAISPEVYKQKKLNLKWKKLEARHMKQFPPGQSTLAALHRIERKARASLK